MNDGHGQEFSLKCAQISVLFQRNWTLFFLITNNTIRMKDGQELSHTHAWQTHRFRFRSGTTFFRNNPNNSFRVGIRSFHLRSQRKIQFPSDCFRMSYFLFVFITNLHVAVNASPWSKQVWYNQDRGILMSVDSWAREYPQQSLKKGVTYLKYGRR